MRLTSSQSGTKPRLVKWLQSTTQERNGPADQLKIYTVCNSSGRLDLKCSLRREPCCNFCSSSLSSWQCFCRYDGWHCFCCVYGQCWVDHLSATFVIYPIHFFCFKWLRLDVFRCLWSSESWTGNRYIIGLANYQGDIQHFSDHRCMLGFIF